MAKQPTATAFTRTQQSWAIFVLSKVKRDIEEREDWLRELGIPTDEFSDDDKLMNLYDDELFYERYANEMSNQREYLHKKFFNE